MTETLTNLALALAVGLIIGLERGWQERAATEGSRIAGIRTFGLIGLFGGLWELVTDGNKVALGLGYLGLAIILGLARYAESRRAREYGVTTLIAALITFLLGVLSARGEHVVAAAAAVVVATLLSLKPELHRWLKRVEPAEIHAALKLLLVSVVVLPILPNEGYGPWKALNPHQIWLLVTLIAGISFAAYVLIRIAGPRRGILLTGLLGGLVSSTAASIQLARMSKTADEKDAKNVFAAGTLVASATMFLRVLIIATIVQKELWTQLLWPVFTMALPLAMAAAILARKTGVTSTAPLELPNPLDLAQAARFGALLTMILLISRGMREVWGNAGAFVAAGAAGLADVDAITISLARMTTVDLPLRLATQAIILASLVNTLTKGALTLSIGGRAMGIRVLVPMALTLVAGAAAILLF